MFNRIKLRLAGLALLMGILVVVSFPLNFKNSTEIIIEPIGDKNEDSMGREVWLKGLIVDQAPLDLTSLPLTEGWDLVHGTPVAVAEHSEPLTWSGTAKNVTLLFAKHPYSGYVNITVDGKETFYDLYDPVGLVETIELDTNNFNINILLKYALVVIFLSIIFYLLICLIYSKKFTVKHSQITYFCLPLFVWLLYWTAFFPGLMSGDSIDQWRQIQTLELSDAHPAFHTFVNWMLTRVWNSPAIISLTQIIIFSTLLGMALSNLDIKYQVNRGVLVLITLFFAVSPVHGMLVNSLWKDLPYSLCLFWLTYLLIVVYLSKGEWLKLPSNQIHLIILLVSILLFRHNGIIPAFGVGFLLFIYYKGNWKGILRVFVSTIFLFVFVKYFLYSFFDISPTPKVLSLSLPIHQVGAMMYNDVQLDSEQKVVVEKLMPIEFWKGNYHKYTVDTLIYHPEFNLRIFDTEKNITFEFIKVWLGLSIQHPRIAVQDWLYQTSIIWRAQEPPNSKPYYSELGIVKTGVEMLDKYQLTSMPLSSSLNSTLGQIVRTTWDVNLSWFIWRPAIYLYLSMAFCYLLVLRNGWRVTIILSPVILNTISLMLAIPAQQLRYVYSALIIAPLIIAVYYTQNPGEVEKD